MLELSAVISVQPCPPRSPDFNPCEFWLWGYLKDVVFSTLIVHLAKLKPRIAKHILNVIPETLRAVVEHAVSRFQLLLENGGQRTEHVLHHLEKFKKQFDGCFLCGFLASGQLKIDMMDAFYADFNLRTIKNQFFSSIMI